MYGMLNHMHICNMINPPSATLSRHRPPSSEREGVYRVGQQSFQQPTFQKTHLNPRTILATGIDISSMFCNFLKRRLLKFEYNPRGGVQPRHRAGDAGGGQQGPTEELIL